MGLADQEETAEPLQLCPEAPRAKVASVGSAEPATCSGAVAPADRVGTVGRRALVGQYRG
ncbi:hypothetical protein I547_2295 [Mycobacterium kansasii 824]|nr:hypothetical protein I547_2295 [Mycobacterium kansasii 824]